MTARVAFVGAASPRAWRDAFASARAAHGAFVALVRSAAVIPADAASVAALSRYATDDELRAAGADAVVTMGDSMIDKSHRFLWIDLETTGLDPARGLVLEFAAVLCEDSQGDDFAIVQQFAGVVHHDAAALQAADPDPYVLRMHNANGLWNDVLAATTTIADVDAFLAELASSLTGGRERAITLAGSSVHFDHAWCRVHFPRFARFLSHRVFDVTTLRAAVDAWSTTPIDWPKRDAHRALADVLATIAEARVARRAMGLAPAGEATP